VSRAIYAALAAGRRVLLEGAQGSLLDLDHGTYPYVTSSSTTAGGAATGVGIGPRTLDEIVGVVKAYTTRVGNGPFPSEDNGEAGAMLRSHGQEFGAVTRRPRRCGWMDLPVLRYSAALNGLDSLIITKLDVLDDLDEIPVCIGYESGGQRLEEFPSLSEALERVRPIYRTFPGWKQSTFGLTKYADLPREAREYLEFIRDALGIEISVISTGPERDQSIILPGTRLERLLSSSHTQS
jgi:adenylosuccinate synthase